MVEMPTDLELALGCAFQMLEKEAGEGEHPTIFCTQFLCCLSFCAFEATAVNGLVFERR